MDGEVSTSKWPLDTIAYCTEGVVALAKYNPAARAALTRAFEPTVGWLIGNQSKDGSWGTLRSADSQRSPRVLSLLSWWTVYGTSTNQKQAQAAINRYLDFLWQDHANPSDKDYGIAGYSRDVLLHTTSFVGLAVADVLEFGITF